MKRIILHTPPQARFHFGKIGHEENMALNDTDILPHSDTLFSALANTAVSLAPKKIEAFISAFQKGTVLISSGNFCVENSAGDFIYFLPKPAHVDQWEITEMQDTNGKKIVPDRKALRRIKFISEEVWRAGLTPQDWLAEKECVRWAGEFVITQAEAELLPAYHKMGKLYQILDLPKVRVHHDSAERAFFNQTSVQLSHYPGIKTHYYFLLRSTLNGDLENLLFGCLEELADQGIGGERRVGCGRLANVTIQEVSDDLGFSASNYSVGISLLHPTDKNELDACLAYQPVLRGGRRIAATGTSEAYLKRIRFLQEGVVTTGNVIGELTDLQPDAGATHPFWRYGRHFPIALHPNLAIHDYFN